MSTPEILDLSPPQLEQSPSCFRPFVKILEQPYNTLRFRYSCEGRAPPILGASSTPENKTPLTIKIVGYQGRVVVVVSCVTEDVPYRPHPVNLKGPNCQNGVGVFEADVTSDNPVISFSQLVVQNLRKKEVQESLRVREGENVDPFLTGFEHSSDVKSFDLHVMRLCFQVFLKNENGQLEALAPVVSNPIYNRRAPLPRIYCFSHCSSDVDGTTDDIILLCSKMIKEDIEVQFFETNNDQVVWKESCTFDLSDLYDKTVIQFRPPKYHNQNITEPVRVSLQLVRLSDGASSRAIDFEYLPL